MRLRMKTMTYALKAKELLKANGIEARVVRDLTVSGKGCVHAVEFGDAEAPHVLSLLERGKLPLHPSERRAGRG